MTWRGIDRIGDEHEEGLNAMLDTIFLIATSVFFAVSVIYVKFCDGLR